MLRESEREREGKKRKMYPCDGKWIGNRECRIRIQRKLRLRNRIKKS